MAVLLRDKRGTQKPAVGATIDGNHPLAGNLALAAAFAEGGGAPRYYFKGRAAAATVNTLPGWSRDGATWAGGTGNGVDADLIQATRSFTIAALITPTNTATRNEVLSNEESPAAHGWTLFVGNTSGQVGFGVWNGGFPFATKAITSGVPSLVVGTRNPDTGLISLYVNGVTPATASAGADPVNSTSTVTRIGASTANTGRLFSGTIHQVLVWTDRCLTPGEVGRLLVNPYSLWSPQSPRRSLWIAAPSTVSYPVSLADTVSISDSVTRTATDPRALSDTVAISDTPARVVHVGRGPTDTVPVSDTVSRTVADARPLADTVPITDALSRTAGDPRTLADSVPISDSIDRLVDAGRLLADTVPVSDVVLRQLADARALADLVAISDTLTVEVFGPSSPGRATGTVTRSNRAIVTVTYARRVTASTDRAARLSGRAQRVGSP